MIGNGETKSVTTITQFHSSAQTKQNLVSKQIERLYGADPLAQVSHIKNYFIISVADPTFEKKRILILSNYIKEGYKYFLDFKKLLALIFLHLGLLIKISI